MCNAEQIAALAKLREPFPAHQISKLPKPTAKREVMDGLPKATCKICGNYHATSKVIHLDYVGHAALTDRLLDTDPAWEWKPMAFDADGLPKLDKVGGLWIYLTVCGITRPGYGNAEGKSGGDAMKEIIGDALRNAAMRFGAALDLWHKGDLHVEEEDQPQGQPKIRDDGEPIIKGWTIEAQEQFAILADRLYTAFRDAGKMGLHAAEAEKWRKRMSTLTAPEVIGPMETFVVKLEEAAKKTLEGLKGEASA